MFNYLEELDGTPLAKTIAENRIKKFFSRTTLNKAQDKLYKIIRVREEDEDRKEDDDQIRIRYMGSLFENIVWFSFMSMCLLARLFFCLILVS